MQSISNISLAKRKGFAEEKTYFTKYFWKIELAEERSLNATWNVLRY